MYANKFFEHYLKRFKSRTLVFKYIIKVKKFMTYKIKLRTPLSITQERMARFIEILSVNFFSMHITIHIGIYAFSILNGTLKSIYRNRSKKVLRKRDQRKKRPKYYFFWNYQEFLF